MIHHRLKISGIGVVLSVVLLSTSCTDLSEHLYDQVMTENYYNSKQDIINAVFRPFEHCYSCVVSIHEHEELPSDQLMTCSRGDWWYDGGKWEDYHYHTYSSITREDWTNEWTGMYQGIGQANLVLDDLKRLDPSDFGLSDEDFNQYNAQLRGIRAHCYLRLLNMYRHCCLVTSSNTAENMTPEVLSQVEPKTLYDFIEEELIWCSSNLPKKTASGGNGLSQGQLTQGAAAALLVRLYLNAEKWIGEAKWEEVIDLYKRFENGDFGYYAIDSRWDAPFDWNNETCDEVIWAFSTTYGRTNWHQQNDVRTVYGRGLPYGCEYDLGNIKEGGRNPKYALQPSYDNSGNLFNFQSGLGLWTQKFAKYPGDKRYRQYRNLGNNTREGMFFLQGYVPKDASGNPVKEPTGGRYTIYLRDQVGQFWEGAPDGRITGTSSESILRNGDFNSGVFVCKYPFYPDAESGHLESDFVNIRYTEVLYSAAESYLRLGNESEAGKILNRVRKRNYDNFTQDIAYIGSDGGTVELDLDEMLDEWGREFLAESRRRTDLIRFGKFGEEWWDKTRDNSTHWELYPLSQDQLNQNKYLKQNPGYSDPR